MVKFQLNPGAGRPVGDPYGETFPFELMEGNHEAADMDQYLTLVPSRSAGRDGVAAQHVRARLLRRLPEPRAARPHHRHLARDAPRLPDGYADYEWVSDTIDEARAAGIRWVIIANHFDYISTGDKGNEMGTDMFNLLVAKKVDLVLQSHEHAYQRSKQLALGAGCAAVPTGVVNSGCIVDDGADGLYDKGDGPVVVINGTGGRAQLRVERSDPEAGYFARLRGSEGPGGSIFGFSSFTVSETSLQMTQVRRRAPPSPTASPSVRRRPRRRCSSRRRGRGRTGRPGPRRGCRGRRRVARRRCGRVGAGWRWTRRDPGAVERPAGRRQQEMSTC